MKTLYKSAFVQILYSYPHDLFVFQWLKENHKMEFSDFQYIFNTYMIFTSRYPHQNLFWDYSKFNFTINTELQDWIQELFRRYEHLVKLKKIGVINAKDDLFAQLSIEQTLSSIEKRHNIKVAYFEQIQEVQEWLVGEAAFPFQTYQMAENDYQNE